MIQIQLPGIHSYTFFLTVPIHNGINTPQIKFLSKSWFQFIRKIIHHQRIKAGHFPAAHSFFYLCADSLLIESLIETATFTFRKVNSSIVS